jgi:WD40 repeat protein
LYAERSKGVGKAIYCVARSSDGQYLVACGCDNLVYLWQRQP